MHQMQAYPYIRGPIKDLKLENKRTVSSFSIINSVDENEKAANIVLRLLAGETLEQVGGNKVATNALSILNKLINSYLSRDEYLLSDAEYPAELKNALVVVSGIIKLEQQNTLAIEQAGAVLKPLIKNALIHQGAVQLLKDNDRDMLICGERFKESHQADTKAISANTGDAKSSPSSASGTRIDLFMKFITAKIPNIAQRHTLCKRFHQGLGACGVANSNGTPITNHVIWMMRMSHVMNIDVRDPQQTYSWSITCNMQYAAKDETTILGVVPGGYATDVVCNETGIEHEVTFSSNRLLHDLLVKDSLAGVFLDAECRIPGPRFLAAIAEEEFNLAVVFPLKLATYQLEQRKKKSGKEFPQLADLLQLEKEIDIDKQRENLLADDYKQLQRQYEKRCWDLLNAVDKQELTVKNTAMPGEQWYMLFAVMKQRKLMNKTDNPSNYVDTITAAMEKELAGSSNEPIITNVLLRICNHYNAAINKIFDPAHIELNRLETLVQKMHDSNHDAAHLKCLQDIVTNLTKLDAAILQYQQLGKTDPLAQRKATALTEIFSKLLENSAKYINADGFVAPKDRQQYKNECFRIKKAQNAVLKDPRDKFLRYTLEVIFILFSAILGFIPAIVAESYRAYKDGMFGFWACRTASNALAVNVRNSFMAVAEFKPLAQAQGPSIDHKMGTNEGVPLLATAQPSQYNSTSGLKTK